MRQETSAEKIEADRARKEAESARTLLAESTDKTQELKDELKTARDDLASMRARFERSEVYTDSLNREVDVFRGQVEACEEGAAAWEDAVRAHLAEEDEWRATQVEVSRRLQDEFINSAADVD